MSRNKKLKKNRTRESRLRKSEGIVYQPSEEVITAKHWLPDFKEVWDQNGDLRNRLMIEIESADGNNELAWEDAIVMDPETPDPVKVIGANWIHADVHGVMTKETFFEDLTKGIDEFADMIYTDQNPFQPVRMYKDAANAYMVGYFDWRGDEYPFDIRTVVQFGSWEFMTDKNETVQAAGFRFWVATLVLPKEEDADVHVGKDMAKAVFDD